MSLAKIQIRICVIDKLSHSLMRATKALNSFADSCYSLAKKAYLENHAKLPGSNKTKRLRKKRRSVIMRYWWEQIEPFKQDANELTEKCQFNGHIMKIKKAYDPRFGTDQDTCMTCGVRRDLLPETAFDLAMKVALY